jgi:BlaI family transcriptional regulator, penicillinase repressor
LTSEARQRLIPIELGFIFSEIPALNHVPTPTPRELEILKVLWEQGPSSVRAVYNRLLPEAKEEGLAYNTIQTLLRIMEDKGLVRHHVEGRTFVYSACYSRDESVVRFLDRVFDGAADQLVMSLLRTERITPEEFQSMLAMISEVRRSRGGTGSPRKARTAAGE